MSAEPPLYDDAISRVTGSQADAATSDGKNGEPVYSLAVDLQQTDQSKYSEDSIHQSKDSEDSIDQSNYSENDIIEALQICQEVENAVADEGIDITETQTGHDSIMSDPVYQSADENGSIQDYKKRGTDGVVTTCDEEHMRQKFGNSDFFDPLYKGSKSEDNEALQNINHDMLEPVYRRNGDVISNEVVVFDTEMLDPVYHDAKEHLTDEMNEVQLRPASIARRKSQDAENVYSFAKDADSITDLINKRHGIHGEKSSVHGDTSDLSAPTNGSIDQNFGETENQYMSLKDVVKKEDIITVASQKLPQSRNAREAAADNSKPLINAQIDNNEYEFVDYAKVKKSKKGHVRHEAIVTRKVTGQKQASQLTKKTPALSITERERRTAKQKSKALKRSGQHPFNHHSSLQNPKDGAIGELEDSQNLTDYVNPFSISSSDSYESFTDSSFDSYESDSSQNSFHSGEEGPPRKALPHPPEKKKKGPHIKNLIHHHHNHHTLGKGADEPTILPFVSNRPRPPPALPDRPEKMSQGQVKLSQVLESLANSERSYIESLERLHQEYTPIFEKFGLLSKSQVKKLFKTVEDILNIHKIGQVEMGDKFSQWYSQEKIGALFGFFSKDMVISPYSEYVNHYEAVSEIFKEAMTSKPAFLEELKTKQCSSTDRLSLAGLMLKPIQRFPQFIMIIKDILKHTPKNHHDRENLQEGLTGIENVAHQLNEGKRRSEQKFHGQEILSKLSTKIAADKKAYLIRQDDVKQLSEELVGAHQSQSKTRRLFLLNDKLVSVGVTQREQDGHFVEKFTYKWSQKLEDLELQTTAIMPHMVNKVTGVPGINPTSIVSPKTDGKEEDPFQLASDLSDMLHDVGVLSRIAHLTSTLKCSYQGFSEELIQRLIADLQAQIQNKDYQLQLLNSSSIIIRDKVKSKKYVFETTSPAVKQEWYIDFMLTKYALDIINIPSWYEHDATSNVIEMPAFLMRHMSVDMQRTYSRIKCAIPVYLPVSAEGAVEHLWVCSSTESAGHVSIVSVHTPKPNLVMSFKATDCDIEAVVMVPGFAIERGPSIFEEDTVWISTAKSEICVFILHENLVKQHQDSPSKVTSKQELTQFVHRFKPESVVISMVYQDDCVFCGTRKGTVIVYGRDDLGAWGISGTLRLCEGFSVMSMITVGDGIWAACGRNIYIIATDSLDEYKIQDQIDSQKDNQILNSEVQCLTKAGVGVWVSFYGQSKLFLYHMESKKFLQEVDITTAVNNFISVFSGTKETRKDYKVTSLVASLGLLWVGTSDGIILTYPLPRLRDGVPKINKRPHVSLHGHNGPAKFLVPVHYGPVNGAPLRRKVSSIIRKSDTEAGVLPTTVEGKNETDEVFVDCREKPQQDENLYESVRMSKGSQHEYECNANIKLENNTLTDNMTIKDESDKTKAANNEISNNIDRTVEDGQETIATQQVVSGASGQDLQTSGEHTYFVLEPQKDLGDTQSDNQNNVPGETDDKHKNIETHQKLVEHGATAIEERQIVQKQLSFNSELSKKVQERKLARELEEQAVDEAEVDDLYGFLKSETKVNTSRTLGAYNSGSHSETEHAQSLQGSLYRRPNFKNPFEAKKPNTGSVKRRSSVRTSKVAVEFSEPQKSETNDKHRIGSSFSCGSSVDTLRKQDTKTMLVVGGGNGYKDWKKRQSYQYRTDEACLVVWMYKV